MEYRVGTCNKCGKQWKLPASFQGERAKPREEDCLKLPEEACDGVVEVGPVVSGNSGSGAAEPSLELEEVSVHPKKREGPSMKERLLAQRRADEAAAAGAARVPASKPAAQRPAERKPAAKPARTAELPPAKPRARHPGTPAEEAGAAAPKAGRARATGGASGRGAARRSAAKSEGSGRSARRRAPAPDKKKSAAPLIGGLLLLAVGGSAWYFLGRGTGPNEETLAAEQAPQAPETPVPAAPLQEEPVTLADETTGSEDAGGAANESATEKPAAPPKPVADPSTVDLGALEAFAPDKDTSAEEWDEIQKLVATSIDPMAGAAGNRAKAKLITQGRKAMPAIINKMAQLDYMTEIGFRDGDLLQRTMMDICGGTNVGWKYSTEPADVLFNKKAVVKWHGLWSRAKDDDAYWANMAKLDKPAEPAEEEPKIDDADLQDLMGGGG